MRRIVVTVGIAALVTAAACGKSEQQKAADQAAQQLEQAAKSAESGDTAKSLEEMGKALGALAGGVSADQKTVEPVSFKELQVVFPEIEGWEKGEAGGERMATPVPFSQANVTYTRGDSSIEVTMVDSGFNQLMMAPLSMYLATGYERETEDGFERAIKVAGSPGWEKWNKDAKSGELGTVVGKRFIMTVRGDGIEDTKVLHDVAARAALNKLPK